MPNNHGTSSFGAPPKPIAKPRKPSRILHAVQNSQETSSSASEKRNTKRIRKNIRDSKV